MNDRSAVRRTVDLVRTSATLDDAAGWLIDLQSHIDLDLILGEILGNRDSAE